MAVLFRASLLPLLLLCGLPLHAQQAAEPAVQQAESEAAAPDAARIVQGKPLRTARLFRFTGDVQVQRTDNTGEDTAVLNMPLTAGTRVTTGDYAQAEVEFDDGSIARLTPRAVLSIDLLAEDDKAMPRSALTVLSGLVYLELRHIHEADWSVDAGPVSAEPTANVVLRVGMDQPPATFAVISGSVRMSSATEDSGGYTANLRSGESFRADPEDASRYFLNRQFDPESWDSWNQSRDDRAAETDATRTAARENYAQNQAYGWSDLDSNGTWYAAPAPAADGSETQGSETQDGVGDLVWQPNAAAGEDANFDPYGDGAFVWSGGSYVWASSYAWGWTPYRCGRWDFYPGLGWVWRPNRFCLSFGYGGYSGVFLGHRHPPRYRPIGMPIARPAPVHPILRVKSPVRPPEAPRDPRALPIRSVARVDGRELRLLDPVGGVHIGQAFLRDYPVDAVSHRPITGVSERPVASVAEPVVTGWIARQASPAPARAAPRIVRTPTGMTESRSTQPVARPASAAPAPARPAPAAPAAAAPRTEHVSAPAAAPRAEPAPAAKTK